LGQITGLRRAKNNDRQFVVYLDGEKLAQLNEADTAELDLKRGMEAPEGLVEEVMRRGKLVEGRMWALRFLARRGRSRAELQRYLKTKGIDTPTTQTVLDQLEKLGLVSDADYARAAATNLVQSGRAGPRVVYSRLRQKGVAAEVAASATDEAMAGQDEEALAERLAEKRLRALSGLDAFTRRRRLYAFLARRGFSSEAISHVIARLTSADEEAGSD
jgi:regulatory protein